MPQESKASQTTRQARELVRDEAAAIADVIWSGDGPMGIDASKTHVSILHGLLEMEH